MVMIWFDMDGTIANLYGVNNWLPMLREYNPAPYAEAEVMLNMSLLARYLNKLQAVGYGIGIISWLSKNSTAEYDEAVTAAKLSWLNQHLKSVDFDVIHIVEYGTPKSSFRETDEDILFDDEERNREEWGDDSYLPDDIIEQLKNLLRDAE